jgi:isoaspartyl peptidase/L-asparaginase-like protein (Ntn-hydrolase superfamily)
MKIVMAKTAVEVLRREFRQRENDRVGREKVAENAAEVAAQVAAEEAVDQLARRGNGTGGLILLDRNGHPAFAFNTPRMAYGYVDGAGSFLTSV